MRFILSVVLERMVRFLTTVDVVLKSHSQKSATFRFDKSAKNVKNNGPKTEKHIFSLLNLLQKY